MPEMETDFELITSRLLITAPRPSDAESVAEFMTRNRSFFNAWFPDRDDSFFTADWQRKKLESDLVLMLEGSQHNSVIRLKDADPKQVIGQVNLNGIIRRAFHSGFLGYHLDESLNGQGLMAEALKALVEHWFGPMNLHRIEANIIPSNLRSKRMIAKVGFQKEGFSPSYLRIDGQWRDHEHWVLLNDHWKA